jgi:hypothetical protein
VVLALANVQAEKTSMLWWFPITCTSPVAAADTSAGLSAVSEPGIHVTHDDPNLSCLY